jgi:hypothetical protein
VRWLVIMPLFALAACNDSVKYRQVPVEGLPRCAAGLLRRPLVLEIEHPGGKRTLTYAGFAATRDTRVGLPEHKGPQRLRVRVGICDPVPPDTGGAARVVRCLHPDWLGEPQEQTIDVLEPHAKVTVSAPGSHPCAP